MPERHSPAETSRPTVTPPSPARCAARLEASADALTSVSDAWILGSPPPPGTLVAIADDIRATARELVPPGARGGRTRAPATTDGSPAAADTHPVSFAAPDVQEALSRLADRLDRTRRTLDDYVAQHLSEGEPGAARPGAPAARER